MTAVEFTNMLTPRLPKKILLSVAGIMWIIAGLKINYIAWQALRHSTYDPLIVIPIILAGYIIIYKFVFLKIIKKHTIRIVNKKKELNCIFSFLDIKGYLIMAVMIIGGVTFRKSGLIPLIPLGITYGIMGLTLITAAFKFFEAGLHYDRYIVLYKRND
jgi:hypothetical protein